MDVEHPAAARGKHIHGHGHAYAETCVTHIVPRIRNLRSVEYHRPVVPILSKFLYEDKSPERESFAARVLVDGSSRLVVSGMAWWLVELLNALGLYLSSLLSPLLELEC